MRSDHERATGAAAALDDPSGASVIRSSSNEKWLEDFVLADGYKSKFELP
jgi:hypothetical protein